MAQRLSFLKSLLSMLRVLALARPGGFVNAIVDVLASSKHFWWKRFFPGLDQPFSLGLKEGLGDTELSLDLSLGWYSVQREKLELGSLAGLQTSLSLKI